MPKMRAKMKIGAIVKHSEASESLKMFGVSRSDSYPADGSDENNTYAKFSPSVALDIQIANPALIGKFEVGQTFYVDFTEVK